MPNMMKSMPRGGRRPGAGRPRKYGRAKLKNILQIRSTDAQMEAWIRAAGETPLPDWARTVLDRAAQSS